MHEPIAMDIKSGLAFFAFVTRASGVWSFWETVTPTTTLAGNDCFGPPSSVE